MSNPGPSCTSIDNYRTKDKTNYNKESTIGNGHENSLEITEARRNNGVAIRNVGDDRVASFDYNFNPFEEEDFNENKKTDNVRTNIGLNVTTTTEHNDDTPGTPDYINETVLYNQFDNINIDQTNNNIDERRSPNAANFRLNEGFTSSYFGSSSTNSSLQQRPVRQAPPVPTSLSLNCQAQRPCLNSPVTPCSDDGLSLSPLPVTEYLDPPPAYSEATRDERQTSACTSNTDDTPPRTRVILPATDIPSVPNGEVNRKYVTCQHCGMRVHTLVLRQSGLVTHVIAMATIILCLVPLTLLVYWTKYFKYRNHYCPYCSKLIGFEIPILCQKMTYVDSQPV